MIVLKCLCCGRVYIRKDSILIEHRKRVTHIYEQNKDRCPICNKDLIEAKHKGGE